jgi:AbrB family looped-hinge helix DNA binding protein
MARSTVRSKGQITIPREVREAAHLEEGDPVEVEMTSEGILLRPQKVIDPSQWWYWTPEWQAGEREADAELAAGRGETFNSAEEFLEALQALAKPATRRRRK